MHAAQRAVERAIRSKVFRSGEMRNLVLCSGALGMMLMGGLVAADKKGDPAEFRFEPPKGADILGEK